MAAFKWSNALPGDLHSLIEALLIGHLFKKEGKSYGLSRLTLLGSSYDPYGITSIQPNLRFAHFLFFKVHLYTSSVLNF